MLRRWDILSLLDMYQDGMSMREMARVTGHSRNTVRKWLQYPGRSPGDFCPKQRASKLDPYKDYLKNRLSQGITNSDRLLREIKAQGYSGGVSILKDFLKPFRSMYPSKAVLRYETAPGEQAQMDFGEFRYRDGGVTKKVYMFAMILSYSRMLYLEFIDRQDLGTLVRCHQNAFEFFGGLPQKVLYDNMKTAVVGRDDNGQVRWNQKFLDFARLCGFTPRACWPYRAQTKGKVERAIGYVRGNLWPVEFTDLPDLNRQAAAWVDSVANIRIHDTTKEQPAERFKQEQLRPLIPRILADQLIEEERTVSWDGYVSYRGARYGVSWQYAGRTVTVRTREDRVEIWLGERRLITHTLAGPGETVTADGQWDGLPLGHNKPKGRLLGLRVSDPVVEVRSLLAYEAASGGEEE